MRSTLRKRATQVEMLPSIGRPVAVSSLATLLLRMHSRPILQLITTPSHDENTKARSALSALEQRQV